MSLYDNLGNGNKAGAAGTAGAANPQQMLQELRSNPAAILRQRGLSIPDGMTNPQQIIQHLLNSGQVPQSRYLQAMQMLGGRR